MDDASYEKVASKLDELSMKRMEKAAGIARSRSVPGNRRSERRLVPGDARRGMFATARLGTSGYCGRGSHWRIDDLMDVAQLAGDMPRELYRKAGESIDTARRRTIAGLARALESRRKQSDLLAAARCRVVVSHTDLDKRPVPAEREQRHHRSIDGDVAPHARLDLLTHDTEIPTVRIPPRRCGSGSC